KVLAPGYYARHDMRSPMRIAVCVLVLTQLLNLVLVPVLQHAALTLTIALGAVVNAVWLLVGLVRRGSYRPEPGWGRFVAKVIVASAVLGLLLAWGAQHFDWVGLRAVRVQRMGLLALFVVGAAALYFAVLAALGVRLRNFIKR
ncbi:MAG: lipid II flippase MurJ, partial [Variovorax sp.]